MSAREAELRRALGLPLHRADVPVDSCRFGDQGVPCESCANVDRLISRRHRSDILA